MRLRMFLLKVVRKMTIRFRKTNLSELLLRKTAVKKNKRIKVTKRIQRLKIPVKANLDMLRW